MAGHVDKDNVGGVGWLAARGDNVEVGVAGSLTRGEAEPVHRDSIFRIASMTKPIVAVGAMLLVEECQLRLDDPVDDAASRARRPAGAPSTVVDPSTATPTRPPADHGARRPDVPARLGMDFEAPWPQPLLEAMGELGLGSGPPEPQVPPAPDEWIRRLSTLPLLYQPGERWLYNTGSDVLGVLVARAAGQPLEDVPARACVRTAGNGRHRLLDRLTSIVSARATRPTPATGARSVYDAPAGAWATPPAFPSGGGGLVSTLDDLHAFGRMLLAGGRLPDGSRLLSRASVEAMTTDQIDADRGLQGPVPTAHKVGASASACRFAAPAWAPRSGATDGQADSARRGRTTRAWISSASC